MIRFLLAFISINHLSAKEVTFADDFTVAGLETSISIFPSIRDYWGKLTVLVPKYGYFPKASKSYLTVKEDKLNNANVNITMQGKRHLGAVIGSNEYREEYVKDLVNDWNNQLVLLSSIAESQPQAAYFAFLSGFKSKLNYFMRPFPGISQFLDPVEETFRNKLICNNNKRQLLSRLTRYVWLTIPIFYTLAETEFENSRKITSKLTPLIINQSNQYNINGRKVKQLKQDIKQIKENNYKSCLQELIFQMNGKEKRLVKISTEKSVSNWLTMLPITEHGFELSKQQFLDSVSLRYDWEITNLPTFCPCGSKLGI